MGQSARLRLYRERLRNDRTIDRIQPIDRIKIGDRETKFFLPPSPSGRAVSNCEKRLIFIGLYFLDQLMANVG